MKIVFKLLKLCCLLFITGSSFGQALQQKFVSKNPVGQDDQSETNQRTAVSVNSLKYADDLKLGAARRSRLEAELLRRKYNGDARMVFELNKIIYDRELGVANLLSLPESNESNRKIQRLFMVADSLSQKYFANSKSDYNVQQTSKEKPSGSKFSSAIANQHNLKLERKQVDSLESHAIKIAELKAKVVGFDAKAYERKILPKLLSDDQYTQLLILENRNTAYAWALGDWMELKQRGIHQDLDSASTVNKIMNYNLGTLVKKARFGNNPPEISASIKKLETERPEGMKRIRQARAYNNPMPDSKEQKTKFTW